MCSGFFLCVAWMMLQMYSVSAMLCLQCDHVDLMPMFHMDDATRVHSGDQPELSWN